MVGIRIKAITSTSTYIASTKDGNPQFLAVIYVYYYNSHYNMLVLNICQHQYLIK